MSNVYKRLNYPSAGGGGSSSVKDPVSNVAALPLVGNNPDDLRYVESVHQWYQWDGSQWNNWTTDETANRVLVTDANKQPISSSTTTTQLSYLDATSSIQTQLNTVSGKADDLITLSGVAANAENLGNFTGTTITNNSTIKTAIQELETALEALPDPMEYKGVWNADTNTPTLTDGTGNNGDVYYVSVAGTQFSPAISFAEGDKVVYSGATGKYEKWDMTDAVSSVNGQTGAVSLDSDDISEGSTNLYFTDERVDDRVNALLVEGAGIDLTYNDGANTLTIASTITQYTDADAKAAAVADSITNGITDVAPSQNAVFDALALKQDSLGFTAENVANKATDFTTLNNTLYPTTQAVQNAILSTISAGGTYMFSGINSDISGYESAPSLSLFTPGVLATTTVSVTTTPTLLEEFATNLNYPNITIIPIGQIITHFETQKASGAQTYYCYFELYKRSSGGTETLLLTSDNSSVTALNTVQQISVSAFNSSIITLLPTDRLVVKIYAVVSAGSHNITIRYDDNTNSRIELPFSPLSYVPENVANKSTNTSLGTSDILYPTQNAVKAYVDAAIGTVGSPGDISETSFTAANNQSSAANVTGFAFANATVRSFEAQVSVFRDATASAYEEFAIKGIQKGSDWDFSISSIGDDSGVVFTVTTAGQVQYTSTNLAGHVSSTIKFRALTLSV